MAIPIPGEKVRGSETGAPIMAIMDLLGRKWALGVIWNMTSEPMTFREIQKLCESISPSILNSRIKDLREADIITRSVNGYYLTGRGIEIKEILTPLGLWSNNWAKEVFNFVSSIEC